jgi:predicted metal-dependent peptidase
MTFLSPGNTERKLTRARTQLLLNQPFFGTLCLRLKLTPGSLPTMATNGREILYNPTFVDALKPGELEAVVAHEVLHCALGHHCRRGERDSRLWNEAADLAINPILVANGFTLPAGALLDPSFDNLSAEEIYARRLRKEGSAPQQLPRPSGAGPGTNGAPPKTQSGQQQSSSSQQSNCSGNPSASSQSEAATSPVPDTQAAETRPGGFGEVLDATDDQGALASPAEQSRQQYEWGIAADQAIRSAQACGRAPGKVERPLRESRETQQDWRAILRDFVAATTPSDYRWSPPNRRYIGAGLYLPSVCKTGVGEIVIAVDTSGSIGERALEQFAGEISAICDEAKPEAIHVIYCDAEVQAVQHFGPSEPIALEPKGGGGTDFCPVFEWVRKNDVAPVCLIYLTDLCCHSFPEVPEYPVLWVTDSRRAAPFGETIRINGM